MKTSKVKRVVAMKTGEPEPGSRDKKVRGQLRTGTGTFPVVAIGASAGGLDAYTEFFHAVAANTGMAFVLVQHLDPSHHSLLADIIAKATGMPVEEVRAGMRMRPSRVYVIPPGALMALAEDVFTLTPRSKEPGQHLTVNFFMRSLAHEEKSRAIGIVLSGTGADGTLGLEDIKAEGGITFAQDPASAKYDGMPRSAIASGCVDFVLPPKDIAKELQRITRHPYVSQARDVTVGEASPTSTEDFAKIIDQLRRVSGVDFSQYKPNTIHRRALRRMVILKLDSVTEYAKYLKEHAEEAEKLYDDVLIPVTSFFRDLEAFEALKAQVYPAIVKDMGNKGTIRMWAPGCSTGEETYSLAMTLLEFLGDKAPSYQIQIFGTDLNEKGIQKARIGVYRESIAEEVSPERLQRFFVREDEGYRVTKGVRDMCVFARQNLASDPPFSQMNVVACRNLLIYLAPALQKKIVPILHYALKSSGFLLLGKSEGVSGFHNLFSTVDEKHKIYAKTPAASRLHYDFSQTHYPIGGAAKLADKALRLQSATEPEFEPQREADRVVLENYAPVGVVINGAMEVVQFRGRTTPYLEQPPGKPSLNVLKLAGRGLALELRSLINAAKKKNASVRKNDFPFDGDGHKRILNLSVSPLGDKRSSQRERYFLVLFEDVTSRRSSAPDQASQSKGNSVTQKKGELQRLKAELSHAQEALRAAVESEEATKEEFQAANEEILSANEELQSTNEELETSKEELQSANEELNTLNAEMGHKNTELHDVNNDLSNFMNSTRLPVVMLDRNLQIRRLTSEASRLLKAAPSDIGRTISDIRLNIKVSDLEPMSRKVLDGLQPLAREVQDLKDRWHALHILPYRTLDNKIDGVVLVLVDIDAVKSANEQLKRSATFFRAVIDTVREPLLVLDSDLRIIATNESFLRAFAVSSEATVNKFIYRLGNEQWNIPKLQRLLEDLLAEKPKDLRVSDFEVEHDFPEIGRKTMLLNARRIEDATRHEPLILVAIEDITERKRAQEALRASERLMAAGRMAATIAHEINNPLETLNGVLYLLAQQELDQTSRELVARGNAEIARVTHIARQTLGLYTKPGTVEAVKIASILDAVLDPIAAQLGARGISVDKRYEVDGMVHAVPVELHQVFTNLILNAAGAMGRGGKIVLHVCDSRDWTKPRRRGVRVVVADTGSGIRREDRERIFDAFFTTKDDKGTGLGLWVTLGIIGRYGGSLRMHTSTRLERTGTCFSLFFPTGEPSGDGAL